MNQIRKVERAARKVADAQKELREAILLSHGEGASLRQLGKASGLSHETVRGLIRQDQT